MKTKADIVEHLSNDYPLLFSKKKEAPAARREYQLTKMSLSQKRALIKNYGELKILGHGKQSLNIRNTGQLHSEVQSSADNPCNYGR